MSSDGTTTEEFRGTTATISTSIQDGAVLVKIETSGYTGRVRVHINEAVIYDADPELSGSDNRTPTERAFANIGKLWEEFQLGDDVADTLEAVQSILTQLKAASA